MALKKIITLENGIPMSYHRIAEIKNIVNYGTVLIINSYVNQEQRNREKNYEIRYADDIYKVVSQMKIEYNDKLDIKSAYEYLKTTEKYQNAEDIFEENEIEE